MSVRARPQSADGAMRRHHRFNQLGLGLDLHNMGTEGLHGEVERGRSPRPINSPRLIAADSPVNYTTTSSRRLSAANSTGASREGSVGSYYNQHLFNRLHLDATLKQKKLDRRRAEEEREIKENTIFRSSSSLSLGGNKEVDRFGLTNPETRLHESGKLWAEKRDSRLASIRGSMQAEEKKKEMEQHTFQPVLHSKQQPRRYESKGEVFEALYESRNHYNKRAMERKWIHASGQADTDLCFSPRSYAPKSASLADKYRKEREDKIINAIGSMAARLSQGDGLNLDDNISNGNVHGRMSVNEFNNSKSDADFQRQLLINTEHIQVSDDDVNNNYNNSSNNNKNDNNNSNSNNNNVNNNNAPGVGVVNLAAALNTERRADSANRSRPRSPSVGSYGGASSTMSVLTTSSRGGVRRYSNNVSNRSNSFANPNRDFDQSSFGGGYSSIPSQPQSIHDSLYLDARINTSVNDHKFRRSFGASTELTHNPNIGVNHFVMTESDRDSFFQRLYDHRLVVDRVRQSNDKEFYRAEMGRNPELDKKLTKEDEKRVVEKFAVQEIANRELRRKILRERIDKEYQRAVYSSTPHHLDMMSVNSGQSSRSLRGSLDDSHLSSSISTNMYSSSSISSSQQQPGGRRSSSAQRCLTDKRSEKISQVSRRRALCELFEILKMTEDYRRHSEHKKSEGGTSGSSNSSSNIDQIEQSLNTMTLEGNKSNIGEEERKTAIDAETKLDDSTSAIPSIKSSAAVARDKTDGSLLDPCLAQAHMIKPKALADVIGSLLESVAPNKLTLQSFIQLVEAYIAKPHDRPISVYLTAPTKKYHNDNLYRIGTGNAKTVNEVSALDLDNKSIKSDGAINISNTSTNGRSRSRDRPHSRDRFSNMERVQRNMEGHLRQNTLSSDDRFALEVKQKPDLKARLMTERLVQDRYKNRNLGHQSVHDSLRSYQIIRQGHLDALRRQADAEEMKECTFVPRLAAKDTYRQISEHQSPLKYKAASNVKVT